MNRVYHIIIFQLFVCHLSMAQADSNRISNLPLSSFLTLCNDSIKLIESQDHLIGWNQIEKVDSITKWKLIGLKVIYPGYHARVSELDSITKKRTYSYSVIDTLPEIDLETLNKYFKLNESNIRLTRNWSYHDLSTDWTPFQKENVLMISKRDRTIGNTYDSTTVYEYYFEEIE